MIVQFATLVLILRDMGKYINQSLVKSSEDELTYLMTMYSVGLWSGC
jgi:hypothetical protein